MKVGGRKTQDPAATTSLTVSPRVAEGPHHPAWLPPAGFAFPGPGQGMLNLMDGPTATQWLMLQVVSHVIGERSQVAVDGL